MEKEQNRPTKLTPFWQWLPVFLVAGMMFCVVMSFVFHDETGHPSILWIIGATVIACITGALARAFREGQVNCDRN